MIDLNFENNRKPQQGYLLVAEPFMNEDYFKRSVVLLCEHNEKGSFGFVLNNYLDMDFKELTEESVDIDSKISIGGPVDITNFFYIHSFGNLVPESTKISETLYLGGDYFKLMELIKSTPSPEKHVRFFAGYSGWGVGQLETEIKEKSWIVVKPKMEKSLLDTTKNNLWQDCLQNLGGKYKEFNQIPLNPHNN